MRPDIRDIPSLAPVHLELRRVLRAAVGGRPADPPPTDWAAVLALASAHEVAGFLFPAVRTWDPALQPDAPLMARWRHAFLDAAARYTRAAFQARELLSALRAAGVVAVPLKGVWLAERVYEDGACRPMSDIDLLVPTGELARACVAVERLGYVTTDFHAQGRRHLFYRRPETPLAIELHWRLGRASADAAEEADEARAWIGLREERLHEVPVQVFPPERQLVCLVCHILRHRLAVPLKAYLDLVLVCRRYAAELDPVRLEEEARAWRAAFGTRFVLQVAGDIFGADLRACVAALPRAGDGGDEARRAAMAAAFQLDVESCRFTPDLEAFCGASGMRRLRIGFARLFLPPPEIRLSYPRTVRRLGLAGGYAWRVADLLRHHGRTVRAVVGRSRADAAGLANFAARRALTAWIGAQECSTVQRANGAMEIREGRQSEE